MSYVQNSSDALTTIPDNYSCRLVFRRFAKTLMHEHSHLLAWVRQEQWFQWDDGVGISRRHYCGINACLEHYLSWEWPKGDQSARWDHHGRHVKVFIDDLFLCPTCGTFRLVDLGSGDLERLGVKIEGEVIRSWPTQSRVTSGCARQIRQFCESRLEAKEFFLKKCDDTKVCETVRGHALSRFRREYRTKRSKEYLQLPQPLADIPTVRKPEKLPWDEGYVYLVRCGGFHKIGLAKDADKRLSGLKTSSPFEMELLKKWRCKRPDTIEVRLHERFKSFRKRGEWFQLSEDVVQALLKLEDLNAEFPVDE